MSTLYSRAMRRTSGDDFCRRSSSGDASAAPLPFDREGPPSPLNPAGFGEAGLAGALAPSAWGCVDAAAFSAPPPSPPRPSGFGGTGPPSPLTRAGFGEAGFVAGGAA